jgi:hypothetical protein
MESSIMGFNKTSNKVECLLNSQPSRGIIRTTADYFFLPNRRRLQSCKRREHYIIILPTHEHLHAFIVPS